MSRSQRRSASAGLIKAFAVGVLLMWASYLEAQLLELRRMSFRSQPEKPASDVNQDSVLDEHGNLYQTGLTVTLKYDSEGNLKWVVPIPGLSLALLPGGDLVVVHSSGGSARISPDGTIAWAKTNVYGRVVKVEGSGSLRILGNDGFNLKKLSAEGEILWETDHRGSFAGAKADFLAIGPAGQVFLMGLSDTTQPPVSARSVVECVDSNGSLCWINLVNGGENSRGSALVVASSGDLFVTGTQDLSSQFTFTHTYLVRFDPAGKQEQLALYKSTLGSASNSSEYGTTLALDRDENLLVASRGFSGSRSTVISKYTSEGVRLWSTFHGPFWGDPLLITSGDAAIFVSNMPSKYPQNPGRVPEIVHVNRDGVVDWIFPIEEDHEFPLRFYFSVNNAYVRGATHLLLSGTKSDNTFPFYWDYEYQTREFLITEPANRPEILESPRDLTTNFGTHALLTVRAAEKQSTPGGLTYQWLLQGEAIGGATNSTLAISKIGTTNSGWYSVMVSNQSGAVVTPDALVVAVPEIHRPHLTAEGKVTFEFSSERGLNYDIQVSGDLQAWQLYSTITSVGDSTVFIESELPHHIRRWYRVKPQFSLP
ncbi:MAG: immunoglobulin domain-containing protein [Verrucomicrobiales bacterium]|nr:immunoglobulin domain-containing protein [Verrucomicrobiales bacterium]